MDDLDSDETKVTGSQQAVIIDWVEFFLTSRLLRSSHAIIMKHREKKRKKESLHDKNSELFLFNANLFID